MSVKDFESNFKVIRQSLAIDPKRKFDLLTTQIETLSLLYFNSSEEVTEQEEYEAKTLDNKIKQYLNTLLFLK